MHAIVYGLVTPEVVQDAIGLVYPETLNTGPGAQIPPVPAGVPIQG